LFYANVPKSCGPVRGDPEQEMLVVGKDGRDACRISVTITRAQHAERAGLAKTPGVTKSWIVRRAAKRLTELENGGPLFPLVDNHAQR
jgi:hypothetical protein